MRGSPAPAPSTAATSSAGGMSLMQVSGRADAQRGQQVGLLLGDGQDQHVDVVEARPDRRAHLDAAQLRHPEVEHQHGGVQLARQRERLAPVRGQAHDLDARLARQQRGGALAHEAVVVGDEDAHALGGAHGVPSMVGSAHG